MDAKLLGRAQIVGAILIAIAYFLPWASLMSPFGSIELRGIYVDYSWVVLLAAIAHLFAQVARLNSVALGIPATASPYIERVWRFTPLLFLAFFVWYGVRFVLASNSTPSALANFSGASIGSVVRAGLDYGYWIALCGAVLLAGAVGLVQPQPRPFAFYSAAAVALATCVAGASFFIFVPKPPSVTSTQADQSSHSAESTSQPGFNFYPYVRIGTISAQQLPKDYEASRYSDSIVINPVFKNVSKKAITGLQGRLSVLDGFGNEVFGFNFRYDEKILPGGDSSAGGYSFEENQFDDSDPYHKMAPLISGGTAKYSATILRIAFEDGTVLPGK